MAPLEGSIHSRYSALGIDGEDGSRMESMGSKSSGSGSSARESPPSLAYLTSDFGC